MKIERTKNTVRNIAFGFISKIIGIILPFFSRTVILYVMGAKYLGLSSLFTSILSFLSLAELGVGSAMVYSMYKPIAENDHDTVRALMNLYRNFFRIIGTVIAVLGIGLVPFLKTLVPDELPDGMNLYVLYFLYLFNTVLSYWLFAYKNAVLQAYQRTDVISKIGSVITPASYVVMLLSLFLTKNYYVYVCWLPVFTVATNIWTAIYVDRHYPEAKPRGRVSKELKSSIGKKVAALIGTKLNTVVLNSADNLVMSAFLGLTAIAMYGNYYYIMSSITGFLGICYGAMTAGLGNSLQTETLEKNYRDFIKLSFINSWLVGWCAVCLVCLYQPFMKIWVGEDLMFPWYMVALFGVYFYIYMIRRIPVLYKDAAGIWWEDRFRPYVCMVTNVVFNILLVQLIGISGIIISTVLSLLVSIPWENYTIFKYVFNMKSGHYYARMLVYAVTMIIGGTLTFLFCAFLGDGIVWLLIKGVVCLIVPNAVFIALNFKRQEFKDSVELVGRIFKRRF